MNTVIFSTNKAPWGGSEDLWKKLCIDAKVLGFNVLASYIDHPLKHNHILELIDAGIAIQRRTPTSKHSNTSLTNLIKDTWVKKKNSNAKGKKLPRQATAAGCLGRHSRYRAKAVKVEEGAKMNLRRTKTSRTGASTTF